MTRALRADKALERPPFRPNSDTSPARAAAFHGVGRCELRREGGLLQ